MELTNISIDNDKHEIEYKRIYKTICNKTKSDVDTRWYVFPRSSRFLKSCKIFAVV